MTFEHASGWDYGDNFFFVDIKHIADKDGNGYYGVWHPRFNLGKLSNNDFAINFMIRNDRSIEDETCLQISPAWSIPITLGTMNFEFCGFLDYSTAEGDETEA